METLEKVMKYAWSRYGDFVGDFELIHFFLVFLLNLNRLVFAGILQQF